MHGYPDAAAGVRSPEELVASAQQLIHGVANDVMRMERTPSQGDEEIDRVESRLGQAQHMLQTACSSPSLSALFRQKASQQLQEANSLSESLVRLRRKSRVASLHLSERAALLPDRAAASARTNASLTNDFANLKGERESLIHSATKLRNIVSESNAILGALKNQGNTLEGTNNRLAVDFLESIGVSNHTLLQIARTTKLDALIVYIGICLIALLMLYILFK